MFNIFLNLATGFCKVDINNLYNITNQVFIFNYKTHHSPSLFMCRNIRKQKRQLAIQKCHLEEHLYKFAIFELWSLATTSLICKPTVCSNIIQFFIDKPSQLCWDKHRNLTSKSPHPFLPHLSLFHSKHILTTSLPLSLSLSHTHTHTHTILLSFFTL